MVIKNIVRRPTLNSNENKNNLDFNSLSSLQPKLQEILINRGVQSTDELDYGLKGIIPPNKLLNTDIASACIYDAIKSNKSILIIGDFDADGATSSALMMKSLKMLGADDVDFLVPDRFKFGYGLSVKLVEHAALRKPNLIITVDNGISNHAGVARANEMDIPVIITDHHLAAETLPNALTIVNPNQPDDSFPSKNLAGVGVAFYLMLALRSFMRSNNWFEERGIQEPNLAELLDLVALGTVADVVPLDRNNRILVEQGLKRIRSNHGCFGINALLEVALKKMEKCRSSDLGFALGPRLNAAGRLEDMSIGIECLLAASRSEASALANRLDHLNRKRRELEQGMVEQANSDLEEYFESQKKDLSYKGTEIRPTTLCLYDPKWHQGVIGILASRIKDKVNRPIIIFAKDSGQNELAEAIIKGSARSVRGIHIRDLLALVDTRNPGLILKFGGHAMAAGLSILEKNYQMFSEKLHQYADEIMGKNSISDDILTDGELSSDLLTMDFAQQLKSIGPWGQGFLEPMFDGVFKVYSKHVIAEKHLKLILCKGEQSVDAIKFFMEPNIDISDGDNVRIVYKLDINEFRGNQTLQLMIEQIEVV